jgi:hypothetical protein
MRRVPANKLLKLFKFRQVRSIQIGVLFHLSDKPHDQSLFVDPWVVNQLLNDGVVHL